MEPQSPSPAALAPAQSDCANPAPSETEPAVAEQIMLVLCGLVGSGKSTFAHALCTHFPTFVRCNQDALGSRQAVEQLARDTLRQGLSPCIDRTNVDPAQRKYWVDLARSPSLPGSQVKIWALVFDTPKNVCAERLLHRTDHPTLPTPEKALEVLTRFSHSFRPPTAVEGFSRILFLPATRIPLPGSPSPRPSPSQARTYSPSDIADILDRLRAAVPVSVSRPGQSSEYSAGGGWEGRPIGSHALAYPYPYPNSNAHTTGRGRGRPPARGRGHARGRGRSRSRGRGRAAYHSAPTDPPSPHPGWPSAPGANDPSDPLPLQPPHWPSPALPSASSSWFPLPAPSPSAADGRGQRDGPTE